MCHTDLHIAEGFLAGFGIDPFPLVLGHEVTGVVEQVGADVNHLNTGERVGVYYVFTCGRCRYCLSGQEEACLTLYSEFPLGGFTLDGGYARYMKVPADYVIPLPEELDFVAAAPLFCGGLTVYGGFKNAELRPGQRAAVLGIGGLGHLAIPIARAMGAEVIAITSTEAKVELARQLGGASGNYQRKWRSGAKAVGGGRCGCCVVHYDRPGTPEPSDRGDIAEGCPGPDWRHQRSSARCAVDAPF